MVVLPMSPSDRYVVEQIASLSGMHIDVEAELARAWALPLVARQDQAAPPIAFLLAWRVADELHIIDMATHPDHRRRGAARALLGHVIDHGRTGGSRYVLLEVRRSNGPAVKLYESLGLRVARMRKNYYSDPVEDALEMMLVLKVDNDPAGFDQNDL